MNVLCPYCMRHYDDIRDIHHCQVHSTGGVPSATVLPSLLKPVSGVCTKSEHDTLRQEHERLKHELALADDEISDYKCRLDAEKEKSRKLSDFPRRQSLERQVKIAVEALREIASVNNSDLLYECPQEAEKALSEIAAEKEAK